MQPVIQIDKSIYMGILITPCLKVFPNFQSMLRDMFWGYINVPQNASPLRKAPGYATRRLALSGSIYNL